MKDLDRFNYFLSLEEKYATDLLSRAGFTDNMIVTTPIETNAKFDHKDETPLLNLTLY